MRPVIHEKTWGYESWIINTRRYCGKRLMLNKGWRCSMHHHKVKDETFYVAHGDVFIELATEGFEKRESKVLKSGDVLRVEPGTWHRFSGITDAEIYEFSTHHEDDDSYRHEPSGKVPAELVTYYGRLAEVRE